MTRLLAHQCLGFSEGPLQLIGRRRTCVPLLSALLLLGAASASAAEVFIYDNRANNSAAFFPNGGAANQASNTITTLVADDITPISGYAGLAISNIYFAVINNNAAAVSARPRIRLYQADGASGGPGTIFGAFTFNPISFAANSGSAFYFHPTGVNVPSGTFWMGMTFDNNTGTTGASDTDLNNLGLPLFDPPVAGSSQDSFFQTSSAGSFNGSNPTGSFFNFGGTPAANFYFAVSVLTDIVGNQPPVAIAQNVTVLTNTSVNITLSATDANNDPLTYSIVDFPTNGVLSGSPPNVTYTPNTDYQGPDAFTFIANDGFTNSVPALVSLTVGPGAGLVINPIWDSTILNDPNAATIMGTIQTAIMSYETRFANPVTVNITFAEMGSGLGQSSTYISTIPYSSYYNALVARSKTTNDSIALAHLTGGSSNPVNGGANVTTTLPNLRALGFTANPPGGSDSTISLNISAMNLTRPPGNPNNYDLQAVASHEIDEVLGTISGVGQANIHPADLFRYTSAGARTFTTSGDDAYFSITGTNLLARYNQNSGGDYGDWWSISTPSPVRVQDAFGTPGSTPDLGVELIVLDSVGWDLVSAIPVPRPILQPVTLTGTTIHLSWTSVIGKSYQAQYRTNLLLGSWSNLGSPITAAGTITSTTDTISTDKRRFYHVQVLNTPSAAPAADPGGAKSSMVVQGPFELSTHVINPTSKTKAKPIGIVTPQLRVIPAAPASDN